MWSSFLPSYLQLLLPPYIILSYPSVTCTKLSLASHHSSLIAVGSLHLPRQVFYLCFQLGLLILKLQRRTDKLQTGHMNHFQLLRKTKMIKVTINIIGPRLKINSSGERGQPTSGERGGGQEEMMI